MNITKVNLQEKFDQFHEHWSPKIVGQLNGQMVKIAKVKGEFTMHKHDQEDELFYVVEGKLQIKMEDKTIVLKPGEFVIIPKGIYHQPYAERETQILLFEPATTLNTGDQTNDFTKSDLEEI